MNYTKESNIKRKEIENSNFDDRAKSVLNMRLSDWSLAVIAKKHKVTRGRIHQIEYKYVYSILRSRK